MRFARRISVLHRGKNHERKPKGWRGSSNIADVTHDAATQRMTVKFLSGGTYHYDGVPAKAHEEFCAAESPGSHFAKHIRPNFKHTKAQAMSENIIKIRASSLGNYADCHRRGAATMFRPIIEAAGFVLRTVLTGIGAPIGSGVHAGAHEMMNQKLAQGRIISQRDAEEKAVVELRDRCADGVTYDREAPEMNAAEQHVLRMTRVYAQQVAPKINPIIVEERLEAEVRPGFVLSGQQDVLAREPGRVRDLKTAKKAAKHSAQLGSYSLLARSHALADVQRLSIDFIQRASLKKPQPDAVEISVDIGHAETAAVNIIRAIETDLHVFMNGNSKCGTLPGDPWAFLANPSSMLCGPKYCPAFGTDFCREHAEVATEE